MSLPLQSAAAGSRRWDVVGVGDIDIDMFLQVPALAGRDEKVPAVLLGEHPGGMIANVTCAASLLGGSTAMIGLVGDDAYGAAAVTGLQEFGVDTSLVKVVDGGRTFYCVIMLDSSGEKALTAVMTDCHWPRREDIDPDWFSHARAVHLGGDYLELATWLSQEAKARGALVSLDLEASTAVHGLPALRPLLASADVLFMNHAGHHLFDPDPARAAEIALDTGPQVVVVTQGAEGVLATSGTHIVRVDAMPGPVVDTTGAGDSFIGAFLMQLLSGQPLDDACRYAVAAASMSIRSIGSRTSLPDHETARGLAAMTTLNLTSRGDR